MTPERKRDLLLDFERGMVRCEVFASLFDWHLLLDLATEEYDLQLQKQRFGARLVSIDEVPVGESAWPAQTDELEFSLRDHGSATKPETGSSDRREFTELLHMHLTRRSYDSTSLIDSVVEAVIVEGGLGAELTALADNYESVRVAICGFTVPILQARLDNGVTVYEGLIRLDLAVWTVPPA